MNVESQLVLSHEGSKYQNYEMQLYLKPIPGVQRFEYSWSKDIKIKSWMQRKDKISNRIFVIRWDINWRPLDKMLSESALKPKCFYLKI